MNSTVDFSEMIWNTFSGYEMGTVFGRQSIVDLLIRYNNITEDIIPFRYFYVSKKGWRKIKQKAYVYDIPYFRYLRKECFVYCGPNVILDNSHTITEQRRHARLQRDEFFNGHISDFASATRKCTERFAKYITRDVISSVEATHWCNAYLDEYVKRKSRGYCQACGHPVESQDMLPGELQGELEIHHFSDDSEAPELNLDNTFALCSICHEKANKIIAPECRRMYNSFVKHNSFVECFYSDE